jgi:ribonuclease D
MEQETELKGMSGDGGSQVSEGTEPASAAKLYTEDDIKAARLAQGKADAALADVTRKLDRMQSDNQDLVKEIEELQAELSRKEEDAFAGDEDGLKAIRAKRELVKLKKEFAYKERDLKEREESLTKVLREQAISEISQRYDVSPKLLARTVSYEDAEELAKMIVAERPKSATEPSGFDTGVSDVGGRRSFTRAAIEAMSYQEYKANEKEIDAAYRAGRIK